MLKYITNKSVVLVVLAIMAMINIDEISRIAHKQGNVENSLPEYIKQDMIYNGQIDCDTVYNLSNVNSWLDDFFNTTDVQYISGVITVTGYIELSINYNSVEILVSVCTLAILITTMIFVLKNQYPIAWMIKNIVPFWLLFLPLGWLAFHSYGLNSINIEYTGDDGNALNQLFKNLIEIVNISKDVIVLMYHLIELVIRIVIAKKILSWCSGSLSILVGLRVGLLKIDSNEAFWKRMSFILGMAQLPIFLLIIGILYQMITSWYVIGIVFGLILSRLVSFYNRNIGCVIDTIVAVLFILYVFECNIYIVQNFKLNLNLPSLGMNFVLSYIVNYILTVEAFSKLTKELTEKYGFSKMSLLETELV